MQLFKRVLLSLFPGDFQQQEINPVSLFISFVSAKQFFSVINRKIVENYKLNLFDIALDSFEVKIGFGEKPAISMQQLEEYYGYCAAANLNGYRFLNPGTIGISVSMLVAKLVHQSFREFPPNHLRLFLVATMYLHYVFAAQVKIFPEGTKEEQYNWFVDLFFNFYQLTLLQHHIEIEPTELKKIKRYILQHPTVLLLIFSSLKQVSGFLHVPSEEKHSYYKWLFVDKQDKRRSSQSLANRFLMNCKTSVVSKHFTALEQKLLSLIVPVDLLVKYIFQDEYIFDVCDLIISHVLNDTQIDTLLTTLIHDDTAIVSLILAVTDSQLWKEKYLSGIKNFVAQYRLENSSHTINQDLDQLMSAIGTPDQINDPDLIPDSIRKESAMMENFMNFYITHIGGLWVARGDNGFLRVTNRPLVDAMISHVSTKKHSDQSIQYFGGLLYLYNKSSFYYRQAYENIKAGRERFHLPFKADISQTSSHVFLVPHFVEHFVSTLLQDLSPKETKIYVTQPKIIKQFKEQWGTEIKNLSELDATSLIHQVYQPLQKLFGDEPRISETVSEHITDESLSHIKDRLYNIDFWLYMQWCTSIYSINQGRLGLPRHMIVGITAMVKETLFGLMLLLTSLKMYTNKNQTTIIAKLLMLYIQHVLQLKGHIAESFGKSIMQIFESHYSLLKLRLAIDDNKSFVRVAMISWKKHVRTHSSNKKLAGEDLVWLYSYLKTIQYYNIRYILPRGQFIFLDNHHEMPQM